MEDENFSVVPLAKNVNMSVSQLNRKLGALIDQPAGKLIRSMRLNRAADLIRKNGGTIAEICYKSGFSDQANFTRAFRKQFNASPSEFKTSALVHSQ
jgi:AraC-like DNA-binding protein